MPSPREVLRSLDRQDRERLAQVLSYPEDSAGGLMDPDVLSIRPDVTLDVVLRYLRVRGELPEVFDLLFVMDRQGRYLGSLKLSGLLTKDLQNPVGELMDTSAIAIPVDMHENQVAMEFEHHDLVTAPVIDAEKRLLGWISIDDVVDVIRDRPSIPCCPGPVSTRKTTCSPRSCSRRAAAGSGWG